MVMSATATFVCELVAFIKIILLEILFNSMIIIIIYPIIEKSGMLLEKIFTESKILTKYY